MKKNVLFVIALTVISQLSAQVTKLSNNSNLVLGFPVTSTRAIFIQNGTFKIWATDGTAANTIELAVPVIYDINGGFAFWNNMVYFSGFGAAGSELWVTDGTSAGTSLVKDINSGPASSTPKNMAVVNGVLYFYADSPLYGYELWKSNGTTDGTELVKDINTGVNGSYSADMRYAVYNNELYFSALLDNGLELWKSNGSAAGTSLVKDINPGNGSSAPQFLQVFNNELFFTADNGTLGRELWKTNGQESGTLLVKDIYTGISSSEISGLIELGGKMLFVANTALSGKEIFQSDGSPTGTDMLKDLNIGPGGSNPDIAGGIIINNKLIFPAETPLTGRELYITDGSSDGTILFKDIVPGPIGSSPVFWPDRNLFIGGQGNNHTLYNGKIFFQTGTLGLGQTTQLWITDDNPANTLMVKDFGFAGIIVRSYFYTQSGLYFNANDVTNGYEIFKSNGTGATTNLFADVNPGTESSNPIFQTFILNGKVFFIAVDNDSPTDFDLYVLNGTETALPLQLLSFAAAAIPEGVMLNWTTAKEKGSREFEIQRSLDGSNFSPIGNLQFSATGNSRENYSFLDKDAYQKNTLNLYYRLKITEENLKSTYSQVALIRLNRPIQNGLQVSPVPAKQFVRINYQAATNRKAQLRIINSNGQVVKTVNTSVLQGFNQQVVNIDQYSPGIYYAELLIKGEIPARIRFIKE